MSEPQFLLNRLAGTAMLSLQAARGRAAALMEHAPLTLGVALREGPHRIAGPSIDSLGIGPARWLVVHYSGTETWPSTVAQALAGHAAVCDQSDAYVIFAASGHGAFAALTRCVPVDLRPTALTPESVVVTTVGHINVVLWRLKSPDAECFRLAIARSYADSFERLMVARE